MLRALNLVSRALAVKNRWIAAVIRPFFSLALAPADVKYRLVKKLKLKLADRKESIEKAPRPFFSRPTVALPAMMALGAEEQTVAYVLMNVFSPRGRWAAGEAEESFDVFR